MGEVYEAKDAVNHGVAEGDESIDTAPTSSVDQKLGKLREI
jgi:hypothetical protein